MASEDPIVFEEGTYEQSGEGWKATVHVPHDVRLSDIAPALKGMAREVSKVEAGKGDAALRE